MSRIPSIQALKALESFSRNKTVWQTADELNLTRSAISHQLRGLEAELPFTLLNRVGTQVELSPQGLRYAEDVRAALRLLVSSAARNADDDVIGPLTISCEPSFASAWLCNNIGRFAAQYEGLDLTIMTLPKTGNMKAYGADIYITFLGGDMDDMETFHMADVVTSPMCSPSFLNATGRNLQVQDLLRMPLLHHADFTDWSNWFQFSGLPTHASRRGIVFSDMHLVYAAAMSGQGVALGDIGLAGTFLGDGKLVRPFGQTARDGRAYYCAVPYSLLEKPAVAVFMNWLRLERQIARDTPHTA